MTIQTILKHSAFAAMLAIVPSVSSAREFHVSVRGDDANDGSVSKPLQTISAAAGLAQPGDTVTVHAGIYRERVDPPRGGESDAKRIIYQAAPGEKVVIKGSETAEGWQKLEHDTWKTEIPNSLFGDFNPFNDLIHGDWFNAKDRDHHTGAVYVDGHWLTEAATKEEVMKPTGETPLWFGEVAEKTTTIWAQFKGLDPGKTEIEINVRQSLFYPSEPGRNFITVRGFTMMHAATPWAPPTAEQIGLIGTHWSKGWILENNDIRYSTCVGVTLGKYGDEWDNKSQSADAYNRTIQRGLENGWNKETIGSHIVRNNHISHCEQAGVVGSLGAVFSSIVGNHIHDIHQRALFTGAEMAGVKIHAPIDMLISGNYIHHASRGIWLDWMAQGTRVTGNLLHDNDEAHDLFVEVNHGPYLVDNNIFLSSKSLRNWSQGGAFVHNLMTGAIDLWPDRRRKTPYHKPHSTELAGLNNIPAGDDRLLNNIFPPDTGVTAYLGTAQPNQIGGNAWGKEAPSIEIISEPDGVFLEIALDKSWVTKQSRPLVTTEMLGKAAVPDLPFEQPDGAPYRIDTDYFGKQRNLENPFPGPFELPAGGKQKLKIWPQEPSE